MLMCWWPWQNDLWYVGARFRRQWWLKQFWLKRFSHSYWPVFGT